MSEFRRRLMMQVASDPNALPVGCVRCEYLEGTGTQYIDTGKVVYPDQDINIDFEFTTGSGTYVIVGWRWQGTASDPYGFIINKLPNVNIQIYYGTHPSNNTGIVLKDNRNNVVISPNNKKIIVNGTVASGNYDTTFTNAYNGDKGSEYHCAIFTANIAGTFIKNTVTPMKLYGYLITNSKGECVQNLVPILDPNGKPCMYDTVSKKFHYNKGTGQFLYKIAE